MRALAILVIASGNLLATAYTSTQAGNWTSSATWGGSGVPGSGDTCTISHTVTVQAGDVLTAGNSTPGSDSVTISPATGELVINGSLTINGDLNHQGVVTLGGDSVLQFGNGGYTWKSNTNYGVVNNMLQSNGTSAAHPFTIRTAAGGTNAKVTVNDRAANKVNLAYGTFLRMGSAATKAYTLSYGGGTSGGYLHVATFDHVTFDSGGQVNWSGAAPGGAGWSFNSVTFVNSLAANPLVLNGAANPTVMRLVNGCYFDKPPSLNGNGSIYTRNVFNAGFVRTSSTSDWAQFGEASYNDGNANFARITSNATISGSLTGNYILVDSPNPVATSGAATSATNSTNTGTLTNSGAAWTASTGAGSGFAADASGSAWMVVITGGTGAGQIRSILSNTATTLTVLYPWATIPDGTSAYAILKGLGNPHVIASNVTTGATVSLSYNVAENTGADNNGDLFSGITAAASSYVANYNLLLPSGSRDNPFDMMSPDASARPFSAQHNTIWAGGQSGITLSDGSNVPAGRMSSYQSNLTVADPNWTSKYAITGSGSWTASALGPYHLADGMNGNNPALGTANIVDPVNVKYNGGWGLKAGHAANGYNINESSPPDMTGGVSADPQFLDDTRNFGKWAYVRGYSASVSPLQRVMDGLAALQADPTRVADLISYVRRGFATRNAAFHNAAHDGTDIGAIPWTGAPRHHVAQ